MERENLEFLLSQYLDGTLDEAERMAVEELLRGDGEARRALSEFRKVQNAVSAPVPEINWDVFAEQISEHIDGQTAPPVYSIGLYRGAMRAGLALAASALIAFGVAWLATPRPQGATVLSVVGPQAEMAAGVGTIDISVSEPSEPATATAYIYDENVLANRAVVALDTVGNNQLQQIH